MDEMYSIMRDLLEVKYHQEALIHMLGILETEESRISEDAKLIVGGVNYYLGTLQKELREVIAKLDGHIVEDGRQQKKATVSEP